MSDSTGQTGDKQPEPYVGEDSVKLDLQKHGLSYLRDKNPWDWTDTEVDRLLDAFAREDIAPVVSLPPNPQYIEDLLSSSNCRRCGGCCLVNPLNPAYPGIEAFEDELKSISKYRRTSYRSLKRKTRAGKELRNPLTPNEVAITRWLPLPCMFYDSKRNKCQVYEVRPLVCKLYPVTLEESHTSFAIKVNCEYGKDLYKNLIGWLKDKARNPVFRAALVNALPKHVWR